MKRPSPPRERAPLIFKALRKTYPQAKCELNFKNPLELLVATILSAQCTDVRVNKVTPALFERYKNARAYAKAPLAEIETMIRPTGFYKNKAKSIQMCCKQLTLHHGGQVPQEMEELTKLAGVGRKTANVVRGYAFGKPAITCDTHVLRVSWRMGLTRNEEPHKVEVDIQGLLPQRQWTNFSTLLVWHGRRRCTARKPICSGCSVFDMCPFGQKNVR